MVYQKKIGNKLWLSSGSLSTYLFLTLFNVFSWIVRWLINRSIHCLIDWFIYWSMGWFTWNRLCFLCFFFFRDAGIQWREESVGINGGQTDTHQVHIIYPLHWSDPKFYILFYKKFTEESHRNNASDRLKRKKKWWIAKFSQNSY